MARTLSPDVHPLALELYALLHELDPARWRAELEVRAREQLASIQRRLSRATEPHASESAVREPLRALKSGIEATAPEPGLTGERLSRAWNDFRLSVSPAYERLVTSLQRFDIHVPSLRPTNYLRNLFHVTNGVGVILLIHFALDLGGMMLVSGAFAAFCWTCELTRKLSPGFARVAMMPFKLIAHPHECWRVNSSTWFGTALFVISLAQDKAVACLAVAVLTFADPMAAIIGRRFGRHELINGRTVEGTTAFFFSGTVAGAVTLLLCLPELPWFQVAAMTLVGTAVGAVAELISRRVDDNLSIPVSVAAGAVLILGVI